MNSRQLKRGKDVVGLTLTEIMLVLTVVVLVLLLASEIDLKSSQKETTEVQEDADEKRQRLTETQKQVNKMQEQLNLALEIKRELRLGGATPRPQGQSWLTEQDVRAAKNMAEQLSSQQEDLKNKSEKIVALENRLASGKGAKHGLYIPCWPRSGQGLRGRYHTYDVTYENGLFRIKQSSDWNHQEVSGREKLDGELFAVLRGHPETVSEQNFAEFGRRVESVLSKMRGDNPSGWYKKKCSLVVTINPGAPIEKATFVRQNVGMFPIDRGSR